jgi:hypothetical protein
MWRFAAAMLALTDLLNGQPALKFEVASIKPSEPGQTRYGIRPAPGGDLWIEPIVDQTNLKGPVDVFVIDQAEKPAEN